MLTTYAQLEEIIKKRLLNRYGVLHTGAIDMIAPNQLSSDSPFSDFKPNRWLTLGQMPAADTPESPPIQLFYIRTVNPLTAPTTLTVDRTDLQSKLGTGHEVALCYHSPIMIKSSGEQRWVVGQMVTDGCYLEVEIDTGDDRQEYTQAIYKNEGEVILRLYVPDGVPMPFTNFRDVCDGIFAGFACESLHFTRSAKPRIIPLTNQGQGTGITQHVLYYRYWAQLDKTNAVNQTQPVLLR